MIGWINADLAYQGLVAAGPEFSREAVIAATNEMTDYTAGGLITPIDWTRQHEPPTEEDPATTAGELECVVPRPGRRRRSSSWSATRRHRSTAGTASNRDWASPSRRTSSSRPQRTGMRGPA